MLYVSMYPDTLNRLSPLNSLLSELRKLHKEEAESIWARGMKDTKTLHINMSKAHMNLQRLNTEYGPLHIGQALICNKSSECIYIQFSAVIGLLSVQTNLWYLCLHLGCFPSVGLSKLDVIVFSLSYCILFCYNF